MPGKTKSKSKSKSKNKKLVCPHCGNDDLSTISHCEYVLAQRSLRRQTGKTLVVHGEAECAWEDSKEEHLSCDSCCGSFPVPKGLTLDFD